MNSNFLITAYLLLLISLGYIATDIYLPSLPALAVYFQASDREVQITLFSYLLSFSFSPLIFGPLSDRYGRKKIIIAGILISLMATFGCLFAQSIFELIAARFFQGIGFGAVLIASRAMISDLFAGKALIKQMSIVTMFMPFALALAPTLGGVLQQNYEWQAVFVFLICYLFGTMLFVSTQKESLKQISEKSFSQIFSTYRAHLNNRQFVNFGINFILPSMGLFSYLAISPFLFQNVIGLSPVEYGSLAIYIGATIMLTGYINLKLIKHFTTIQILYTGTALILCSGCLILFFHVIGILNTWSLFIPSLLFFTCMPLCISNSMSKAMSLIHENFGAATALLTTFQFLTGAVSTYIFSWFADGTALPLAFCFILVGTLSFLNLGIISNSLPEGHSLPEGQSINLRV